MTYPFKRIVKSVDEDSILGLTRKQKVEREREFRQGAARFPLLSDGRQSVGFATLSHGSIRTWSQLREAEGHNTRIISGPNIRDDAPEPIELLPEMSGTYTDRARAALDEHGVSHKVREGGTLATEDIYSASPEYWNRDGDWREKTVEDLINDPVVQRAIAFARKRHGKALISCSLHLDEKTPHIHVIALPLVQRLHYMRGPKPKDCPLGPDGKPIDYRMPTEKWSLDRSTLRGKTPLLEQAHDEWAEAVSDLALARGSKGSDMSDDERRTRRQLGTGRASEGGKRIREERERILREAEARAAEIEGQAMLRAIELDLHIDALLNNVEARERTLNDRELDLASREADLAKEQAELDAEKRIIEEAQQAQETIAAANEALTVTLAAFDEKVRLKDAEADRLIEYANAVLSNMKEATAFVAAVTQPDGYKMLKCREGGVTPVDQDGNALAWWDGMASELKAEFQAGFAAVLQLEQLRRKVEESSKNLDAEWDYYLSASTAVKLWCGNALDFARAWKAIPENDRSPAVADAVEKAVGLTLDDLPPGFGTARKDLGR